ncbi:DUF4834 family protein [Flavobacterium agricola]|uniref:DUF4834 family protein n=1 Tax=Flavobacterium agricola TaxID=2870839 RepID=A0ABY6M062_9FLAO|nr:DUF4834 family protein [Flavobacterium agricola]UYW01110.1 DUF4834 family protein [Flavobacterium agricola]
MNTASFTGFLSTILWIVLIYYALKFLFRLFAPILFKVAVQKAEKSFNEKSRQFYEQQNQYSGSTESNHKTAQSKSEININDLREKKKIGEYIDFEEIK